MTVIKTSESFCTEAVWNCDDSLLITAQRENKRVENPCIQIWTPSGVLKHALNVTISISIKCLILFYSISLSIKVP